MLKLANNFAWKLAKLKAEDQLEHDLRNLGSEELDEEDEAVLESSLKHLDDSSLDDTDEEEFKRLFHKEVI